MIGKIIDDFTIISSIGSGGMGNVYIAFQKSLERQIALKIINKSEIANSAIVVERFIREAKIAASIQHPNIINVFGVGEHENLFYIAMEYVPGRTLENIIDDDEFIDEEQAWKIALQICEGLQSALDSGVIHRDIKPGNIILKSGGLVKITDFGISKKLDENSNLTSSGTIIGTPDYMSPEQASAMEVDYRSDIYSLGATIYHLLTKVPIFCGDSIIDILIQHKSAQIVPPQVHRESLSLNTSAILGKMLTKNKEERYQNYAHIIEDINQLMNKNNLKYALPPDCFYIYTFPPVRQKKLIDKITQRISSWITGDQHIEESPGQNKETLNLSKTPRKIKKQPKSTQKILPLILEDTTTSKTTNAILSELPNQKIENKSDQAILGLNKAASHLSKESSLDEFRHINTAEIVQKAEKILNQDVKIHKNSGKEKEEVVKKIKEIIMEMADDVDELLFVSVIGMDGIPIAQHSKSEVNIDSFAAKFTMVMKLIHKSVSGLQKIGALEENLVQAEEAWVLTRFLSKNYFLCIAVSRDGVLGNVRVASQKYASALQDSLGI